MRSGKTRFNPLGGQSKVLPTAAALIEKLYRPLRRHRLMTVWMKLTGESPLQLVRIRNDMESQRPLLPPEQQYFLRENLRLMLYGAQQALLQGSMPTFQQNLKSAQHLLKEYFDISSQAVIAAQDDLGKLQGMRIVTDLPDITASLTTLRRLSGRRSEP